MTWNDKIERCMRDKRWVLEIIAEKLSTRSRVLFESRHTHTYRRTIGNPRFRVGSFRAFAKQWNEWQIIDSNYNTKIINCYQFSNYFIDIAHQSPHLIQFSCHSQTHTDKFSIIVFLGYRKKRWTIITLYHVYSMNSKQRYACTDLS